jgi:leucyl/phenylalanyl-tRNA--protein transferase
MVLFPEDFHISRSLAKTIRRKTFSVTFDEAFPEVIGNCAEVRLGKGEDTWLGEEMIEAYCRLHELGYAHSVECWQGKKLRGGLYGISLGSVFFGESMFSLAPDSSKVAFAALVKQLILWEFDLIDCQIYNPHLESLGAGEIPGEEFWERLALAVDKPSLVGKWTAPEDLSDLSRLLGV